MSQLLYHLWPAVENLIPPDNSTSDGWIVANPLTANNTFFRSQWIECQYPVSGGYGLTARIVFYVLAAISIFGRGHEWAVGAALAGAMIYSSTAAVHALILVGIRRQLAPSWLFPNFQVVLVEGQSPDGQFNTFGDTTQQNAPLWLPIIPMAYDQDCGPTLLITGVAFLLVLPMYNFSKTLEKASPERQAAIVLWILLLFAGLIAALVNEAYVFYWAFPQVRFCPLDRADDLPLQNNGAPSVVGPWDGQDWYLWNRTVRDYFIFKNSTIQPTTTCLYTCFGTSWPLRDPTDIQVFPGNVGTNFYTASMLWFQIVVYVLVSCSAAGCVTLALMQRWPLRLKKLRSRRWRPFSLTEAWGELREGFKECQFGSCGNFNDWPALSKFGNLILRFWILLFVLYSSVLSFFSLIAFVTYFEWEIADSDPGGETFRHVGQWSVLVGAVLALGAATIPKFILRMAGKEPGGTADKATNTT